MASERHPFTSITSSYQLQKFGAMARVTRFGAVSSWNLDPGPDETYEAKIVTDAGVSYSIIPQVFIPIN